MTKPLPQHDRICSVYSVNHAAQIHIQNAIPVFKLIQPGFTCDADASIIENVVQPLVARKSVLDQSLHSRMIGHIKISGSRLSTAPAYLVSDVRCQIELSVGEYDISPPTRKSLTDCSSDAGSTTCNNADRSIEGS